MKKTSNPILVKVEDRGNCTKTFDEYDETEDLINVHLLADLRKVIQIIYELFHHNRPIDVVKFLANKLETNLIQQTLREIAMANWEAKERKKEEEGEESDDEQYSIFEEWPEPDPKLLMTTYHNRATQKRVKGKTFANSYVHESVYQSFKLSEYLFLKKLFRNNYINIFSCFAESPRSLRKVRKCIKIPKNLDNLNDAIFVECIPDLAWSVNGKGSIYDPLETPFDHFKKAYPHLLPRIIEPSCKQKFKKPCKLERPVVSSFWQKKEAKIDSSSKVKQVQDKPIFTNVSVKTDASEDAVPALQNLDTHYLSILIKIFSTVPEEPSERTLPSAPHVCVGSVDMKYNVSVDTQTDYCNVCDNYDLMQDVTFQDHTNLKMIGKGLPLSCPCWTSVNMLFRSPVVLDWSSFHEEFVKRYHSRVLEKNWLSEEEFSSSTFATFNQNKKLFKDKAKVRSFKFEDEEPSKLEEASRPNPLPKYIYYSEEEGQYVIDYKKRPTSLKWEAKAKFSKPDSQDILSKLVILNITKPVGDKISLPNEPDDPDPFPKEAIPFLNEVEQIADYPQMSQPSTCLKLGPHFKICEERTEF
ncbi:hypothetical protein HELRODRAFT_177313 [Helobdella robusta]|uniref:Uncharacterized protein n=1 Tax=Helobdella robusta TaxID=6412 RepID=T1FBH7_HELRO|nr:hypothetical protein HELRODRAFT_177313 [Helobdella robusta]ESN98078.1 hypothetical protein HELRODRAFT_177313 [Helobdella robusta]